MERANIVIIGGGVVGCAVAYELALLHADVYLLEQAPKLGMGSSRRNSGVNHSGIYYEHGSLKARLCVEGNRLTREFCTKHGVPYRQSGKLVVAAHTNEITKLEALADRGRQNGVEGLEIIDRGAILSREPHIAAVAALSVPSAGIISAEDLVKAYARLAVDRGAHILTHARVTSLDPQTTGIEVTVEIASSEKGGVPSKETVATNCVINCAGLYADDVAAMLGFTQHRIYPVRGEYAELIRSRSDLVNGLVYPLPHPEGMSLGVHLTRTLWDTVLLGPTARYVEEKDDYEKNRISLEEFAESAKTLLPEIKTEDLRLGYSGLRAKLVPPRDPSGTEPAGGPADFVICHDPVVSSAIHLIGIESPGLTSALAIARLVSKLVDEVLN